MTDSQTQGAVLMGKFHVRLGGQDVAITEKSMSDNLEFREAVGKVLGDVLPIFAPLFQKGITKTIAAQRNGDANAGASVIAALCEEDIEPLLQKAFPVLIGRGAGLLVECLYLYAPETREIEATFEERVEAGLEVLAVAFPLVRAIGRGILTILTRI